MRTVGQRSVLAVLAASAVMCFGAGVAQAGSPPDVVGQKYSDAEIAISGAGLTAVVSTTVGDQKAWPDCLVDQHRRRAPCRRRRTAAGRRRTSFWSR